MKKLLVIIDGMEDVPIPALEDKTPMEVANMPFLNQMKISGNWYFQQTIPEGLNLGTDIALLTLLGYELDSNINARSWFEALGHGVKVNENDLCLRCNLISHSNGVITSHCGGKIIKDKCLEEMEIIKQHFDDDKLQFYSTGSFRNLLVIKDCKSDIHATGPHELLGCKARCLKVKSDDSALSEKLNNIIETSFSLLKDYQANGIALWSAGRIPKIPFKINGSLITGTPVVRGIGKAIGMNLIDVEGATGDENTNLKAKVEVTKKELKYNDFVILHIEAADELSHRRDYYGKIKFLEKIDNVVLSQLISMNEDVLVRIQADHATSSLSGKHLRQPVKVIEYRNL